MENNSDWTDKQLANLNPSEEWQPDTTHGLDVLRRKIGAGRVYRRWRTWGAVATAACVTLLAFPAPRAMTQRICAACISAAQNLTANPGAPRMVPDFSLKDASGETVTLSDFKGKVVLLNFWATWCPPCRIEIPWLNEFEQTYADRGLVVLGVAMDEDGWDSVKPYLQKQKINYRLAIGNDDVAALYGGVESLPTTVLIDKSGRIVSTHVGLVSKSVYKTGIENLLK